jgi:uncharacterized membrane protein
MCIVQGTNIFATGLVADAFFIGTFAVHPAAAKLDPGPHIVLRQKLIRRLSRFLPPFMLLPIPLALAALMICRASVSLPLEAIGFALSLATVGITVAVNTRLNRRFARWSPAALPRDWQEAVYRWNVAHFIRMMTTLGAFACAILAEG